MAETLKKALSANAAAFKPNREEETPQESADRDADIAQMSRRVVVLQGRNPEDLQDSDRRQKQMSAQIDVGVAGYQIREDGATRETKRPKLQEIDRKPNLDEINFNPAATPFTPKGGDDSLPVAPPPRQSKSDGFLPRNRRGQPPPGFHSPGRYPFAVDRARRFEGIKSRGSRRTDLSSLSQKAGQVSAFQNQMSRPRWRGGYPENRVRQSDELMQGLEHKILEAIIAYVNKNPGCRLSNIGIHLRQNHSNLFEGIRRTKKLKDLVSGCSKLFLQNTGKGKKNNPFCYPMGKEFARPPCAFFYQHGKCVYGQKCKYDHMNGPGTLHQQNRSNMARQKNTDPWGTIIGERDELEGKDGKGRVAIEFRGYKKDEDGKLVRDTTDPSRRTWSIFYIDDVEFPPKHRPKRRLDKKHPFIDDNGYCLKIFVGDIPIQTEHKDLTTRDEHLRLAIAQSKIGDDIKKIQRTHCDIPNYSNETGFAHIIMKDSRTASKWIHTRTVEILGQECKVERMKRDTYKYMPDPFNEDVSAKTEPGQEAGDEVPHEKDEEQEKVNQEQKKAAKDESRRIRLERRHKVGWRYVEITFPKDSTNNLGLKHIRHKVIGVAPDSISARLGVKADWDIRLINGWKADDPVARPDTDIISAKLRKGRQKHLKIEFDTKMESREQVNEWKATYGGAYGGPPLTGLGGAYGGPPAKVLGGAYGGPPAKVLGGAYGGPPAKAHGGAYGGPPAPGPQDRAMQFGGGGGGGSVRKHMSIRPAHVSSRRAQQIGRNAGGAAAAALHEVLRGGVRDPDRRQMNREAHADDYDDCDVHRSITRGGDTTQRPVQRPGATASVRIVRDGSSRTIKKFGAASEGTRVTTMEDDRVSKDGKILHRFVFTEEAQKLINGGKQRERAAAPEVYSLRLLLPSIALAKLGAAERDEIKSKTGCTGMKFLGKSTPGTKEGMRILQFKGSRSAVKAGEDAVMNLVDNVDFLRLERVQERKPRTIRVPPGFGEHDRRTRSDDGRGATMSRGMHFNRSNWGSGYPVQSAAQWSGVSSPRGGGGRNMGYTRYATGLWNRSGRSMGATAGRSNPRNPVDSTRYYGEDDETDDHPRQAGAPMSKDAGDVSSDDDSDDANDKQVALPSGQTSKGITADNVQSCEERVQASPSAFRT